MRACVCEREREVISGPIIINGGNRLCVLAVVCVFENKFLFLPKPLVWSSSELPRLSQLRKQTRKRTNLTFHAQLVRSPFKKKLVKNIRLAELKLNVERTSGREREREREREEKLSLNRTFLLWSAPLGPNLIRPL